VQLRLLPVTEEQLGFAQQVAEQFLAQGVRVEVDSSGDRLGKMVRNAEKAKIPIMAVVGAKELEDNALSLRTRAQGELGALPVSEVLDRVTDAITHRQDF
jgi:threonyl-tRNA synthetase